jgi:HAD superfamily hydrolase (TIGR01509 family)
VHKNKNKHFADILASGAVKPRTGFAELIHSLTRHDIRWAVVTTTSRSNWDALWNYSLSPLGLPAPTTIVVGDDVQAKKPDPEAYLLALQRLSLSAHECYVIEDSSNGLLAGGGAGLPVAIVRSEFFADESFEGAAVVVDELTELVL